MYQLFGKDVIKDNTEKDLGIHIKLTTNYPLGSVVWFKCVVCYLQKRRGYVRKCTEKGNKDPAQYLKHKDYNQRLKRLDLPTLEYRRQRSDQAFKTKSGIKIMRNMDSVDKNKLFHPVKQKIPPENMIIRLTKKIC